MKSLIHLSIFFIVLSMLACHSKHNTSVEPLSIIRYEEDLFQIDTGKISGELKRLQSRYPLFLSNDLNKRENLQQISDYLNDPMIQELYNETHQKYSSLTLLEQQLGTIMANYKKAVPLAPKITVYTYVSGLDFEHPIIYFDTTILIALDMYLNPNCDYYDRLGIPRYISRRFEEGHIARDVAEVIIQSGVSPPSDNVLLAHMIAEGKTVWGITQLLPDLPDHLALNYTKAQFRWCEEHERELWTFLLKNDYLFSSNAAVKKDFLQEGPSTKEFGNEAPAMLGKYLGWKIVQSFHKKHPKESMLTILGHERENEILQQAGYKP
ncbi:MAG: hypothetical protein CSA95_06830 [Bacteroidetes bacterium]|nr:MAG: hypothetical protein CSA95_06830 [Bacteroidota bacterium]PIE88507.1 MAG: hypothetical protein CSA04_01555 [Bacteroidota bacterium]